MIKKSITYTNLDGQLKQEDFWFQLTEADFAKKALTEGGQAYLERLRALSELTEDNIVGRGKEIMDTFESILMDAVGRREDDMFIKDESITKRFRFTGAYDAFFMELITTPDSGATFMRNIFPRNMGEAIDKALNEARVAKGEAPVVSEAILRDQTDAVRTTQQDMAQPTPFPQSLEKAIEGMNMEETVQAPELDAAPPVLETGKDGSDEPKWLQETRYPTQKELMAMSQPELQLAMKMKSSKAFG